MNRSRWIIIGLLVLLAAALYENSDQGILSFLKPANLEESTSSEPNNAVKAIVQEKSLKPGTKAPEFSLAGLDGQTYEVGGKRDKPLLLNFWASWCGPCEEEAPDLVKLAKKYGDELDVYAVNVTYYDKLDKAKEFVQKYNYTFPVLLDEQEEVYRKFNGIVFPTNVLIDRNGVIQDVILGVLSPEELEAKLKKLVSQ